MAARSVQSAGGGEEAAATETMTRGVLVAGTEVKEESDMARRVSVAKLKGGDGRGRGGRRSSDGWEQAE